MYHSKQHMPVCGLSLHQGSTESRKTLEQKFIFQIGTLNPHGINERFSFNQIILLFFTLPCTDQKRSSIPLYIKHTQPTAYSSIRSDERLTLETSAFESLYGGQFTYSPPT